jgi:hypothetical protein
MYDPLLFIHSWLRWIFLILAVVVIAKSLMGWLGGKDYVKSDNILAASFVGTMHLQLLIGLILYFFLSPITAIAFEDFGAAMKNASVRYWAVEHISIMVLAVIVAQIGRTKAKKAQESIQKYKTQSIFFIIALILVLSRIPFNESARLFRF